jgi:hypothetical protein
MTDEPTLTTEQAAEVVGVPVDVFLAIDAMRRGETLTAEQEELLERHYDQQDAGHRWAEVRVAETDGERALTLAISLGEVVFYDPEPPRAGPEVSIAVRDVTEQEILDAMGEASIAVLAHRSRVGRPEPGT